MRENISGIVWYTIKKLSNLHSMEIENATEEIIKEALKFAQGGKLAVISTVASNGVPESATILYSIDNDFNFYFITRNDSRKASNLATNKNVSIVIGTDLGPSTLQMNGVADPLSVEGQKDFIDKLTKNEDLSTLYYGPFLNILGVNFTLYKVRINWARWLTLDMARIKEVYYQIIPQK